MSKADYFKELNYRLRGLPEKERQNILKVYEELFQKAVENGKHEDEVSLSLGYPRVPNWDAQKEAPPVQEEAYKRSTSTFESEVTQPSQPNYPPVYNTPYPPSYPTAKPDTGIKAIIISIMLGFFNLMFVVGPWLGVCAAMIAFFVAGFALLVAPIIGVLTSLAGTTGSDFQFISFSLLACFGLGIIITTLSSWLLKQFFKLSWKYIQFNAKLIKGV